MKLIVFLLKVAGKSDINIDERIPSSYILFQSWRYGTMMLRGMCFSLLNKKISHSVFVGKHVKILHKSKVKIGKKVKLHDGVYIDALSRDGVELCDGVILGRNSRIECTGSIEHIGNGVVIGTNTTFGNDCFFGAAGGIKIGEDVIAGQYIRFHSENHNFDKETMLIRSQGVSHKGIEVGNNCWIGAGTVFLDGAKVGDGCVVAANTVVTKEFPNNVVIAGVPAKILRSRILETKI